MPFRDAVQHYTFVLTDMDRIFRFGFCRYSPDVKTCLCMLRYNVILILFNLLTYLCISTEFQLKVLIIDCSFLFFLFSSYLPWFKGFYELLNRLSNFRRESKVRKLDLLLFSFCCCIHLVVWSACE